MRYQIDNEVINRECTKVRCTSLLTIRKKGRALQQEVFRIDPKGLRGCASLKGQQRVRAILLTIKENVNKGSTIRACSPFWQLGLAIREGALMRGGALLF